MGIAGGSICMSRANTGPMPRLLSLFAGSLCSRIAFSRMRCTLHELAEFLVEARGILPERGVTNALVKRGLGTRHRSGEILSETDTKDSVLNAVRHERRNRYRLKGLLVRRGGTPKPAADFRRHDHVERKYRLKFFGSRLFLEAAANEGLCRFDALRQVFGRGLVDKRHRRTEMGGIVVADGADEIDACDSTDP